MLAKALNIAYSAHQGQIDKGGIPYIQHPIRVALNCLTDDEKIVALLHDVIEDTSVTVEELINEGFNQNIIDAINKKKWGRLYDVYSTCILERTCNISENPRS